MCDWGEPINPRRGSGGNARRQQPLGQLSDRDDALAEGQRACAAEELALPR